MCFAETDVPLSDTKARGNIGLNGSSMRNLPTSSELFSLMGRQLTRLQAGHIDATIYLYGDRFFDPADQTSIIRYSPHFFDSAKCCRVDCGVWYFDFEENI